MKRGRAVAASSSSSSEHDVLDSRRGAFGALLQSLGVRDASAESDGEEEQEELELEQRAGEVEEDALEGSGDAGSASQADEEMVDELAPEVDADDGAVYADGEALRPEDPYVVRYCAEHDEQAVARWKATASAAPVWQSSVRVPGLAHGAELRSTDPWAPTGLDLARDCFVKQRLAARWPRECSPLQRALLGPILSYCDVSIPGVATLDDRAALRDVVALHVVNHVLKAREREWEDAALLRSHQVDEIRDQGFTPCRVVCVVPMRSDAYDLVRRMILLSPFGELNVENRRKFETEMAADEVPPLRGKPQDYRERFGGNTDDSFRFGIRFTRSTMRLFTGFYHSDIIVCSPLGLRTIVGDDSDTQRDFDFLSSVEVLVLDSCEMLQMQNWDHVQLLLRVTNRVPVKIGATDFSRLQTHFVHEGAPFLRQTIALSHVQTPELNALMRGQCVNPRKALVTLTHAGVVHSAGGASQVFQKVPATSVATAADERFAFFTTTLLPQLLSTQKSGVLVYIPSYFDYLRVRSHLRGLDINFCHVCEYTKRADVARDRADFARRTASVMLYTERVHYYHRSVIRGTEHVIFYGLPTFERFYVELLGFVPSALQSSASVVALYSPLDRLALERVVGTERSQRMLASDKGTHIFST